MLNVKLSLLDLALLKFAIHIVKKFFCALEWKIHSYMQIHIQYVITLFYINLLYSVK